MFHETLENIFSLADDKKMHALINTKENQWFERKSFRADPKVVAQTLIAFANAEGGNLIVGISDGKVENSELFIDKLNRFQRVPYELIDPSMPCHVQNITIQGHKLLCFSVRPGGQLYRAVDGTAYVRAGDSSLKLDPIQERELFYDRTQANFEEEALESVTEEHFDNQQIERLAQALSLENIKDVFNARNLLTQDKKYTNASYLLFGKNPEYIFPAAYVRVIEYDGVDRGEGTRLNIKAGKDIRLTGSIPEVIAQSQKIIEEWLPKKKFLNKKGRFEEQTSIPYDAWLEGLVNAVVHRSYSHQGDYIRVEIFSDRIEIESPGRFPGLADMTNPRSISRYARNPRIARVCSDLGITAELGEGIRRIYKEMERLDLSDPQYYQTSGSVKLILRSTERLDQATLNKLPKNSKNVLDFLSQAGGAFGTGDIALALNQSKPTTIKQLNALRDLGFVKREGKSVNDPRASWRAT